MKKLLICLSLVIITFGVFSESVVADEYDFDTFHVEFNGTKIVSSDYDEKIIQQKLNQMEPGDSATIKFEITNNYEKAVDWWMSNDTLKPFEQDERNSVEAGNYTYKLLYTDTKKSSHELYNSDKVGGDKETESDKKSNGLDEATDALDEWFLLETIPSKGTSELTMSFELDGQTQANNYQDVLGQLRVNFAVELENVGQHEPGTKYKEIEEEIKHEKTNKKVVKRTTVVYIPYTGDSLHTAYFAVAELILMILLIIIVWSYILYNRRQGGQVK